ncbi:MAG: hypothetical protein ABIS68_00435 [Casimicrobiaceae bacterium]
MVDTNHPNQDIDSDVENGSGTPLAITIARIQQHIAASVMELYFKDLEGEGDTPEMSLDQFRVDDETEEVSAEEEAFAELAERVSAARLVY